MRTATVRKVTVSQTDSDSQIDRVTDASDFIIYSIAMGQIIISRSIISQDGNVTRLKCSGRGYVMITLLQL